MLMTFLESIKRYHFGLHILPPEVTAQNWLDCIVRIFLVWNRMYGAFLIHLLVGFVTDMDWTTFRRFSHGDGVFRRQNLATLGKAPW